MASVHPELHRFNGHGWVLPEAERARLLGRFPPRYALVIAHHVTFAPKGAAMPDVADAEIVGHADDGVGVEALVVRIGGTTDRPDGSTWHVTWSLGAGRAPRESNDVLRDRGWTTFDDPVPVRLERAGTLPPIN
jgi:hypothetical protein